MTDRKIMKLALEALETADEAGFWELQKTVVSALRERLAQPDAYGYASRLAVAIWEQHYKDVAPQWKPLDDLMGVLTQIDNMTIGLTRLAQPEQEPVAWGVFDHNLHDMFFTKEDAQEMVRLKGDGSTVKPLYTTPPQRTWVGLTIEEIAGCCMESTTTQLSFAKNLEAKLKEKNI